MSSAARSCVRGIGTPFTMTDPYQIPARKVNFASVGISAVTAYATLKFHDRAEQSANKEKIESPQQCAARNKVQVPAGFCREGPRSQTQSTPPSAPKTTKTTKKPSNTPASSKTQKATPTPVTSSSLSSVSVITPSYPVGNATIPVATTTAGITTSVTTSPVVPFTGGADKQSFMAYWLLVTIGVVELLA